MGNRLLRGDDLIEGKLYCQETNRACVMKFVDMRINTRTYVRTARFYFHSGQRTYLESAYGTIDFTLYTNSRFIEIGFKYGK